VNRGQSGWIEVGRTYRPGIIILVPARDAWAAEAEARKHARQANAVRFLVEFLAFPAFVVGLMCALGLVATLMDALK